MLAAAAAAMASRGGLRSEISNYLSVPGAVCVVAGAWLALASQSCSEEARRVASAAVLDSLAGAGSAQRCAAPSSLLMYGAWPPQ